MIVTPIEPGVTETLLEFLARGEVSFDADVLAELLRLGACRLGGWRQVHLEAAEA